MTETPSFQKIHESLSGWIKYQREHGLFIIPAEWNAETGLREITIGDLQFEFHFNITFLTIVEDLTVWYKAENVELTYNQTETLYELIENAIDDDRNG